MALVGNISGSATSNSTVGITGSVIIANRPAGQFPSFPGSDVVFFVSGSTGARGGSTKGVAAFGGDVVISGSIAISGSTEIAGDITEISGSLLVSGSSNFNGDLSVNNVYANVVTASHGLSGSLTKLSDGTSYLIAGNNIDVVSSSNGAVTISASGLASNSAAYVTIGNDTNLSSERALTSGIGLTLSDAGANSTVTLSINDSVVATVSGTTFTGATKHSSGLSGSLTKLTDGTSYLIAGNNITITSSSNGPITISSIDTTPIYWTSPTPGNITTTGSVTISGDLTVNGTTATVNTTNLEVKDAVIGLGFSSGTIAETANDRGIIGGIAGGDNVALIWKNSQNEFAFGKTTSSSTGSLPIPLTNFANLHAANIQGSIITASIGFSGSLTKLTDGTSYLIAGNNITINSSSNGAVTISSSLGDSYWTSISPGVIYTSGSAIVSGVLTASMLHSTASIVDGWIQLLPNESLPNSLSNNSSYIYVSGSTNDLYFTQNAGGYNNTIRLRWLESDLHTGILRGCILSTQNGTNTFSMTSGSAIIVNPNIVAGSEPYPLVTYVSIPAVVSQSLTYSGSAQITYIGADSTGAIIQRAAPFSDGDYLNYAVIGKVIHLSGSVTNGVVTNPVTAYGGVQEINHFVRAFGALKISGHVLAASGSTLSITKTSGDSFSEGRNYTSNANDPSYISSVTDTAVNISKIYRTHVSGSTEIIDSGIANAGYTDIDPTLYNNNNTLSAVAAGQYTIQRVYWFPNSVNKAFYVYYGNSTYSSLDVAQSAIATENFIEGANTRGTAILVGYILVKGNATNLSNTNEARIIQAGLFRGTGQGSSGGTNGGPTLPGGSDTYVQFNDGGTSFGGDSGLTYNKVTNTLAGLDLVVSASGGFSGSLTKLADGTSYLIAGPNVTIVSASNGAVTISSTGGGSGNSYFTSTNNGSIYTTGSTAFRGGLGITSPQEIGLDTFFFVSGSKSSRNGSVPGVSVFGGDVFVSGNLSVTGTADFYSNTNFSANLVELTGSFAVSGSSFFTANVIELTGSLYVTGSAQFTGSISVSGSYLLNVISGTTAPTYNVGLADHLIVFTSNVVTGVLPSSAAVGSQFMFKDGTGNASNAGGQMISSSTGIIDGYSTYTLPSINYSSVTAVKIRNSPEEWVIL